MRRPQAKIATIAVLCSASVEEDGEGGLLSPPKCVSYNNFKGYDGRKLPPPCF